MAGPMPLPYRFSLRPLALAVLLAPTLGTAATLRVQLDGVDGDLRSAAQAALEISQYEGRDVSAAQARRLYAHAAKEIASALEPYGYYESAVDGELQEGSGQWTAVLHVKPGEPVTVARVELNLPGDARDLKAVRNALEAFAPREGQPMNHAAYERGKTAIQAALLACGYLDADLTEHRVDVTRGTRKAAIHLTWKPGQRYRIGAVHFDGGQFGTEFLKRYIPWKEGDYYSQDALLALQQKLTDADYFAVVDVGPDIESAHDGVVPVTVHLGQAKRSIYTGGVFIGTDTGFGVRGGLERRWMNDRGHKLKTEVIVAQHLKTASALYSIPLPGPNDRSYNFGVSYKDENTHSSQSRTSSAVANETRQWLGFTRTLGLHLETGDFSFGDLRGNSTILFPEAGLNRKRADDPLFVHHGYSLNFVARVAKKDVLSDTDFAQVAADAKWIHAFGDHQRLILRGSLGTSWVSNFDSLPPDLRFFAGGDRSIRGYAYQAIGPRRDIVTRHGETKAQVIGGKSLAVYSTEYEYYFKPKWGVATFVDTGDAFSGTDFKLKVGTGIGLRWLSPVGMVRVDVAKPIGDKYAHGFELHLVIGPDL